MRLRRLTLGIGISMLMLLQARVYAQVTSGNLVGTVYDPAGATVPNATLVVRNDATGVETRTVATSAGDYTFNNLPVGTYTLTATAAGFAKAQVKGLTVSLNVTATTNVHLKLGQEATTVEVTEAAIPIDTSTAQISKTYTATQAQALPSAAGTPSGVLNFSLLSAGVATGGTVGAGTGPSVGGQRPRNNNFTVEGIDNNSGSVTGPLVTVPNDAVAEFSALQNQFQADFGHSSGGQYNIVVKSGTNQFHGEAFEYFQNRNLDAADTLAAVNGTPLHPRYDQNRFGGNFGGPIIHDKLFFFGDYEYNPLGEASTPGLLFAPTQAGLAQIAATPGINATNFDTFKKYVPVAPTSCAGQSSCPTVPLGTLADGPLWNFSSLPAGISTIDVGILPISAPNYSNSEFGVLSIDYNPSDKDAMRGRFILNRSGFIDTSASLPVFYTTVPTNNYLVAFSEFHNFSPTVINEFRLGYNRNAQVYPSGNFSFPGLDQFPNLEYTDLSLQVGPDPNAPQYGYQNLYQLTDAVSITKGAHSLKFGFDGIRNISPQGFTQRARGDYEYTYFSDYLFDFVPDSLAERSQGNATYWGNRWLFGWYGTDIWKLRPNLTLSLGLRYEYHTVPASENDQALNAVADVPGLITFGKPKAQTNNIQPRIGIAYSPGTSGKTSIRAGFGLSYDVLYDNLGLLTLPPELFTTVDAAQGTGGYGLTNFLANGGLPPNGPSSSFSAADARANTSGYVPDVQRPEAYTWNFDIQHEFAGHYLFDTFYLGTRGLHLPVQDQLNIQPVVTAANALPVYWSMPSQAALDSLTSTLGALKDQFNNNGFIVPAYNDAGFNNSVITAYMPYGDSVYHGWGTSLTKRLSNGLQFAGSYTWSHAIDNSTADVFSTVTTPRRPENSQDLKIDRSSSALDHRNRFTFELLYQMPYFQHSNWFLKNIVGNWEISPVYTYQTGTLYTVQSALDSNLNLDSWPDRAMVNPNGGNPNVGSDVTALTNSAGDTVAYLVNNPAAGYAKAPSGTMPTAGRNTKMLNPIDDIDINVAKSFNITERMKIQISARAFNVLNHPQYTGGFLNDVAPAGTAGSQDVTSGSVRGFMEPQNPLFGQISQVWSSNPRSMVLALRLTF